MGERDLSCIRPMAERDLVEVLSWRNHPEVRRYMYTQNVISLEEHARWFAEESQDPQKHLLVFEMDTVPVGFVKIHQISNGGTAEWGFYVAPDAPKGVGGALGWAALRYSFESAKLHKICGSVLAFNERSIRYHLRLGFQQEGFLRQHCFNGQQYHDVVCFGLLASEWVKSR